MDSPVPTLYPCLGQWDLSTPVPVILKAATSLTGQTRASCLCAGIQPHPLQSFPDAVVRAIFLTLRSDRVCLLLQCLPLGQSTLPSQGHLGWLFYLSACPALGGPLTDPPPSHLQPFTSVLPFLLESPLVLNSFFKAPTSLLVTPRLDHISPGGSHSTPNTLLFLSSQGIRECWLFT